MWIIRVLEKRVNDGWNAAYSDSYWGWTQDMPSLTLLYFPHQTHTHTHTHTHLCLASLIIQILRKTWILNRRWTTFNSTYLIYPKTKLFLSSFNLLPDLYISAILFLIRHQHFLSLWDLKMDNHPSLHLLFAAHPSSTTVSKSSQFHPHPLVLSLITPCSYFHWGSFEQLLQSLKQPSFLKRSYRKL